MFNYYARLALRSFRQRILLTILMVTSIGLGIGATITTSALLRLLTRDPVPTQSAQLFIPSMDPRGYTPDTAGAGRPTQLTSYDALSLLSAHRAYRQAAMTGGRVVVSTVDRALRPLSVDARYTTRDFFPMFAAPFNEGSAWTSEDDSQAAHVAVISEELNNKAFGGKNSIGKTILLGSTEFRIVGVLAQWQVTPHFYDLSSGIYSEREMVFLPFEAARALKLRFQGDTECWSSGLDVINQHDWLEKLWSGTTNCAWIQYWVQLRTQAERDRYADYIASYVGNQVESGRFLRHEKGALYGTMKWLDMQKVVPKNVRLQTAIALSFLLVCLVNTVGLMLAKFMGNGQSIAVRRALGATRRDIFLQFLVEAASVGLIGGFLGAVLSVAGLALVRMQPLEYAPLAHIDALMLTAAILLSLTVTIAAGMLPAWLVCQAQPSRALRAN